MKDPLELELESFAPRALSPVVGGRIAQDLNHASSLRWKIAAAAILAAACVAIALSLHRASHLPAQDNKVIVADHKVPGAATLAEYRKALAQSSEAFDSLVDAQARRPMSHDERPLRAGMLPDFEFTH